MNTLWWGTYPEAGLGTPTGMGEGLWRQRGEHAEQVLEIPSPSFVVAHPSLPLLYAISETESSEVHVISVEDPDLPRVLGSVPTGGRSGCHLLLSRDARSLYAAHYMSGDLMVIRVGEDGHLMDDAPVQTFGHKGSGPRQERQEAPHAHFVGYAPDESVVLVADLGTDELRAYAVREDGTLTEAGIAATLPPGAGPRHFAVRGENLYVVCELDHMVRTLRWDAGQTTAQIIAEQPSTLAPHRSGPTYNDAHVVVHEDVLLVSVRGPDVIAVFDLSPEGEARYRAAFDVGRWPRHFAVIGDILAVGAEEGHEVRVFALEDVLGLPPERESGAIATLPAIAASITSPACVVAR